MDAVGKFYDGRDAKTAARELAEHKVSASPEAYMYQQRMLRGQMTTKLNNPMIRYARIRSVRYNMDVRIAQLEKMRKKMERRDGESEQEHKERIQALGLTSIDDDGELKTTSVPTEMPKRKKKVVENDDEVGFYFNKLAGAVESDDQKEINKAVLIAFFQENAPERIGEVDTLLEENEGKEEELFKRLAEEHPLPGAKELIKEGDDVEAIEKEKEAIDKDFENRNDGKFVLHMMLENGGKWWVNRQEPAQHASQRKRETLLPQLRKAGSHVAVEIPIHKKPEV